jgi:hypothetical protein
LRRALDDRAADEKVITNALEIQLMGETTNTFK